MKASVACTAIEVSLQHHVSDPESLRLYTKSKLALSAKLRALRESIVRQNDNALLNQCDDLMVKLAEDRFTLAVLGQFKRGKSSLMNAIIGRELLPVGVLSLTSAITVLRYGPKERLLVTRSDVKPLLPEEFPVDRLSEFVTEKENPGNQKHVKTATIELPVPFLRRGLEFVHTGRRFGSIEANTITTLKFLPQCDAVLFVASVDAPFTRVELEFLENIRQHVHKIFFVVNKTDLLNQGERREVLDFVRDTVCRRIGTDDVKLFPVSARLGLESKQNGDPAVGVASGLPELEKELAQFLSNEKASVFLAAIERAIEGIKRGFDEAGLRAESSPRAASPSEPDLARDLKTRACPVCNHLSGVAFQFFSRFQYELAADEETQHSFAEVLGYCALHTWQLEAISSPLGASIGFAKLAEHVSSILAARAKTSSYGQGPLKLFRDSTECHVCRLLREGDQDYLQRLGNVLETPEGRSNYARSQGVCLRHLGLWIPLLGSAATVRFVLEEASRRFEQMSEDMQSFSMKTEALRRQLHNADESDAYLRAIIHLVGTRGNCQPMNEDAAGV